MPCQLQNPGVFSKPLLPSLSLARIVLIIAFILCSGGVFLLEQPQSSLVMEHDRMVWLKLMLKKVQIPVPSLGKQLFCRIVCCLHVLSLKLHKTFMVFGGFFQGIPTSILDGQIQPSIAKAYQSMECILGYCTLGPGTAQEEGKKEG